MMQPVHTIVLLAALAMPACTTFPDLDAAVSPEARRAEYPELIPAEGLLGRRGDGRLTEQDAEDLLNRAANLTARARLLRGAPIDEETRLRLSARLRRLGG
ncbi:MAG: hypothetical protein QNJ16_17345 [Rhodobacter sp.]|nr:hypothetical protein [Rhodobacter sp.]